MSEKMTREQIERVRKGLKNPAWLNYQDWDSEVDALCDMALESLSQSPALKLKEGEPCPDCGGKGKTQVRFGGPGTESERDFWRCDSCDGTGRKPLPSPGTEAVRVAVEAINKLHGLVESIGNRYKGYLPWDEVEGKTEKMFIFDAVRKADAINLEALAALKSLPPCGCEGLVNQVIIEADLLLQAVAADVNFQMASGKKPQHWPMLTATDQIKKLRDAIKAHREGDKKS